MRPTLVVGSGPALFVVGGDVGKPSGPFLLDPDPRRAAALYDRLERTDLPDRLVSLLEKIPANVPVSAVPPRLTSALRSATGRSVGTPALGDLRRARSLLPDFDSELERRFLLALARDRLERALRAPEEILVTLAREEERVERAVGRESRAAESFLVVPDSALDRHLSTWTKARAALDELSDALRRTLSEEARKLVPNLSSVVGPRVAARLVAAAGGVQALARMPSARIQLLGSRRRPSPERGPRYGILYRADRMGDVPLGRRGAYARTLAALAAIAVRADASTGRSVEAELLRRRDRRVEALRRQRH